MALDSELLSAYLDGEVPTPWDERIRERLESSQEDLRVYESLLGAKNFLQNDRKITDENIDSMKQSVWESIQKEVSADLDTPHRGFWHSRLTVPTPLVAAAALLLFFSFGFTLARSIMVTPGQTQLPPQQASAEAVGFGIPVSNTIPDIQTLFSTQLNGYPLTPDQLATLRLLADPTRRPGSNNGLGVTINLQDVNQLLQLLQGASNIREISIELPGVNGFELIGEPTLVPGRSRAHNQGEPTSP